VRISQDSPVDVILGRETIKRLNFATLLPQFFFQSPVNPSTLSASASTKEHNGEVAGKLKRLPLSFVSCKKPCSTAHSGCASSATLPGMISAMSSLSDQVTLAPQPVVPSNIFYYFFGSVSVHEITFWT
jgi:hypothetical protein